VTVANGSDLSRGGVLNAGGRLTVDRPQGPRCDIGAFEWFASNMPPSLLSPGDQSNAEGESVVLQLLASDPDGDALAWAAAGLPPGLEIDPVTGAVRGTISFDAAPGSPYGVSVSVSDGRGGQASASFEWTVANTNRAPTVTDPADQAGLEGEAVSLAIVATDADGDSLNYAATGLPPGLGIDPGTGFISGTIDYAAASASRYGVTVSVTNDATTDVTFDWTVVNVNRAPMLVDDGVRYDSTVAGGPRLR
jgi:hypothetical protein